LLLYHYDRSVVYNSALTLTGLLVGSNSSAVVRSRVASSGNPR
jgi:hypothetical protein